MNLITVKPELHRFDSCREFAKMFQIGEKDFILASKSTYLKHFHNLNTGAVVAFKSDYGPGEPTDLMCEAIMADVEKSGCTRIIAIGGGAVIDIAKALAVSDGNTMDELYAKAPALTRKRGLVIVPTTCGTGSEVTAISILSRVRLNTKLGLVSPALYPDSAVLISIRPALFQCRKKFAVQITAQNTYRTVVSHNLFFVMMYTPFLTCSSCHILRMNATDTG